MSHRSGSSSGQEIEADVELAVQRHHGDVQPRAVEDRARADTSPSTSLPRKYSGTCGPGTLEITRLCTGSAPVSRLRGVDAHRDAEHRRRGELRPVLQQRRADRRTVLLGNGIRFGDGLQPLGRDPRCWSPAWRTCPTPGCGPAGPTCRAPTPGPSRPAMLSGSSSRSSRNRRSTPGHQGHHHVVDLDAEVVLDRLDVLEVELGEGDVAVAGDVGVERGLRRGERRRHGQAAARPLDGVDHRRHASPAAR